MRYEVQLREYRLDAGHVGEETGRLIVWSRHRSKSAAGRALGSLISGKRARQVQPPRGMAYRYLVRDSETGADYPRNACR